MKSQSKLQIQLYFFFKNQDQDEETAKNKIKQVIEKNNERVEELKRSKKLALDVANQLKEKYDEMKDSKQELLEKFRKIQVCTTVSYPSRL